jgi:hypothetical protein
MITTPTLAFLPGGAGPVAIPLLLIVGWYFLSNQIARVVCLVLLVAWLVVITAYAVFNGDWNMLIFPSLVIIAWSLISGVNKSFG